MRKEVALPTYTHTHTHTSSGNIERNMMNDKY